LKRYDLKSAKGHPYFHDFSHVLHAAQGVSGPSSEQAAGNVKSLFAQKVLPALGGAAGLLGYA